jgi:hypothetical protein
MPITPYLREGHPFDADARRVMGVAFEMALGALRLTDHADPIVAIVASKIIDLAEAGESRADLLCERALASLGFPQPGARAADGAARRPRPIEP